MMGILVFESVENHVLSWKQPEASCKWPIFEMHAHWITCACAHEYLCMANENAWEQKRGDLKLWTNQWEHAPIYQNFYVPIYFSSGFDVNVNVLLLMFVS